MLAETTLCGKLVSSLSKSSERKVAYTCDNCGSSGVLTWHNHRLRADTQGMSPHVCPTLCKSCALRKVRHKLVGRTPWNKGKKLPEMSRENSVSWTGGSYIASDGYKMIYEGSDTRVSSGWASYRKEHIVIMEAHLGRKLDPETEVVHHIDCDKLNNELANLTVLSKASHRNAHVSLERAAAELYKQGLIEFDRETGKYFVAHVKLRELLETP